MLRIGLLGAVATTEAALDALAACGTPPVLVMTLPADKSGRHSDFVDVELQALACGAQVLRVTDVNAPDMLARIQGFELDLLMVIGWSRLCGPEFRSLARLGALGFHPTLLPKLRGRAALAWTILLGERETGCTLFWLDEGVDSGDIAAQARFALDGDEYLSDLYAMQNAALRGLIGPLIDKLTRGERPAAPQDHGKATYLALRRPEDGEIDWSASAADVARMVRAVSRPYPGAFTWLGDRKLIIWRAHCAAFPEWIAQTGQIFTRIGGQPVIRCGTGDLIVTEYEIIDDRTNGSSAAFAGQPRLGRRR